MLISGTIEDKVVTLHKLFSIARARVPESEDCSEEMARLLTEKYGVKVSADAAYMMIIDICDAMAVKKRLQH